MNVQSEPTTMWFDRRLVLRASPIHGVGTFATEAIQAGEALIWVTGGFRFTPEEAQAGKIHLAAELYNEERLPDNTLLVTPKVFHYYINHACEPNAVDLSRHPSWTHYVALRDIRAHEEITADYYTQATLESCACGSPRCRWQKPE